jgi:hypothetical protein
VDPIGLHLTPNQLKRIRYLPSRLKEVASQKTDIFILTANIQGYGFLDEDGDSRLLLVFATYLPDYTAPNPRPE